MQVRYSSNISAIKSRLRRLPEYGDKVLSAIVKKDAVAFIFNFQWGIRSNRFGLKQLADSTVAQKERLGYEKPEVPLYGAGDDTKDRSYINMLKMKKLKNGWAVRPSKAMHHSGSVRLDKMAEVHEHGAIIRKGGSLIRIPPRPALQLAYDKTMNEKRRVDNAKDVKKAILSYIVSGHTQLSAEILAKADRQIKNYMVGD